jgi:hypothetical protein
MHRPRYVTRCGATQSAGSRGSDGPRLSPGR